MCAKNPRICFVESELQITDELIAQRQKALVNLLANYIESDEAGYGSNVIEVGGEKENGQ